MRKKERIIHMHEELNLVTSLVLHLTDGIQKQLRQRGFSFSVQFYLHRAKSLPKTSQSA